MFHSRNGQMFASDLVASVVVFFFIVNFSLLIWNLAYDTKTAFSEERQLRERVVRTSDLLVRTPGYPQNWTEDTVKLAGFATQDHVLSTDKLRSFNDTADDTQRRALRAQGNQYHLTVTVGGSVAVLQESGKPDLPLEFGNASVAMAESAAVNKRSVLVNTSGTIERGTLKLVFWR